MKLLYIDPQISQIYHRIINRFPTKEEDFSNLACFVKAKRAKSEQTEGALLKTKRKENQYETGQMRANRGRLLKTKRELMQHYKH